MCSHSKSVGGFCYKSWRENRIVIGIVVLILLAERASGHVSVALFLHFCVILCHENRKHMILIVNMLSESTQLRLPQNPQSESIRKREPNEKQSCKKTKKTRMHFGVKTTLQNTYTNTRDPCFDHLAGKPDGLG